MALRGLIATSVGSDRRITASGDRVVGKRRFIRVRIAKALCGLEAASKMWLGIAPITGLLLAMLVPTKAFAVQTQDFGSFAYSPSKRVVASNIGYSKAEAQAAAEEACRSQGGDLDCQAVAWFRNAYGTFAVASDGSWGSGWGSQSADSDSLAVQSCEAQGATDCHIVRQERTASLAITSFAGGETIAPMRWNWLTTGFTEGQGDHIGRDYWGVDFVSDDPPVYPVRPGHVVFAGWNCELVNLAAQPQDVPYPNASCYGYVVVVDHGNGISSLYAHLAKGSLPTVNSDVGIDDIIGTMSDSGCGVASACAGLKHLHFAVRHGCVVPDPNSPDQACKNPNPLYTPMTPVQTPWRLGLQHSRPLVGPKIVGFETFREGVLVFFRLFFSDPNNDATGFGFNTFNGSESHPFSSPSFGRVSLDVSPAVVEYPFNIGCGTAGENGGDVEAWVYDEAGVRSRPVTVHVACSAPTSAMAPSPPSPTPVPTPPPPSQTVCITGPGGSCGQ